MVFQSSHCKEEVSYFEHMAPQMIATTGESRQTNFRQSTSIGESAVVVTPFARVHFANAAVNVSKETPTQVSVTIAS